MVKIDFIQELLQWWGGGWGGALDIELGSNPKAARTGRALWERCRLWGSVTGKLLRGLGWGKFLLNWFNRFLAEDKSEWSAITPDMVGMRSLIRYWGWSDMGGGGFVPTWCGRLLAKIGFCRPEIWTRPEDKAPLGEQLGEAVWSLVKDSLYPPPSSPAKPSTSHQQSGVSPSPQSVCIPTSSHRGSPKPPPPEIWHPDSRAAVFESQRAAHPGWRSLLGLEKRTVSKAPCWII